MSIISVSLARKYAQAYLSFAAGLSDNDVDAFKVAANNLADHKEALFLLSVPCVKKDDQKNALKKMIVIPYGLPESSEKLINLIVNHKRIILLADVFAAVVDLYNKRANRVAVTVASSHALDENDRVVIQKFLASITGQVIMYDYKIEKQLIVGLRLQSDTFLWEHSIQKDMRRIRKRLMSG